MMKQYKCFFMKVNDRLAIINVIGHPHWSAINKLRCLMADLLGLVKSWILNLSRLVIVKKKTFVKEMNKNNSKHRNSLVLDPRT